jgi:hypothetical protein
VLGKNGMMAYSLDIAESHDLSNFSEKLKENPVPTEGIKWHYGSFFSS